MTPIQQLFLGQGVSKKTYLDQVFSTFLFKGNAGTQAINNSIDLAGEGGLVWTKNRDSAFNHFLYDTERGVQKYLISDSNIDQQNVSTSLTAFNSNGFTLGANDYGNITNGNKATSWTFRRASGFFDCVTWIGNSDTNQTISHSLKSIPGMIIAKRTDSSTYGDWVVYHRDHEGYLKLNSSAGAVNDSGAWTPVTSTSFKAYDYINVNGASYVAYIFAGGESNASEARSVDFTAGSGNYLQVQSTSTDLEMGSSDFTFELWLNSDGVTSANRSFFSLGSPVQMQHNVTGNMLGFFIQDDTSNWFINNVQSPSITDGAWNHVAITRSGNTWRFFLNGTQFYTGTHNVTVGGLGGNYPSIGSHNSGSNVYGFNGKISNVRFVKGTAVYTSSFRPPTEPLTNITNTKLLCCNNSSVTGSTVSPGTLASNGPTASTDSPFDDPAGFVFGDAGDQNVIKCGSFIGNHTNKPEINLGWEPQFLLWKNADQDQDWFIVDSMRGAISGSNDARLRPNQNVAENTNQDPLELTPTGFKCTNSDFNINGDGDKTIFIAIRRSDGYVGKPYGAGEGTSVFAMDTGSGSSTIPTFDSNFVVDWALRKEPATTAEWASISRLTGDKYLVPSGTAAEGNYGYFKWDSNVGFGTNFGSGVQAWMFKRHAGFDVVTFKGDWVAGRQIPHNLGPNNVPEMIWIRARNGGEWIVGHHGVNGGTNPWNYEMLLHDTRAEGASANKFNNTAPTSSVFTVGDNTYVNAGGTNYIAMLFSSTDVSKVGSYTGNGNGSSGITVTTGFQVRFLIIKRADGTGSWHVMDSLRGMSNSGDEKLLKLNSNDAQLSDNIGNTSSTGFTITSTSASFNANGGKYIYYAHA